MGFDRAPILIVDDRPEDLLAMESILTDLGEPVVKASSGQEALGYLLRRDFAVILLDVRMPDMDGLETARYVRMGSRSKYTPIIFMSSDEADATGALRGYSAGAVDYIGKPVQPEILRAKVRVFIDLYQRGRELSRKAEDLERANEELRTAYRNLEVFSYAVAHEFRAPLRAMTSFSQILRDEYSGRPFDEEGQVYASRIEDSARRMDTLVRDLLSYCHVAGATGSTAVVDTGAVVRETAREYQILAEASGAEISFSEDIPAVVANPSLLALSLSSLLENALTFVADGIRPAVRIGHESRRGRVRLLVRDNGLGIPREYYERIFGLFERLDNSECRPGNGIGLAIAKVAVERTGGEIGLESEPGRGSTFWIELARGQTSDGGGGTGSG